MPSFHPGLNWLTLSSESERYDTKKRRRAVSEPTPMDVDGEEGSQFRCSLCNGNRFSFNLDVLSLSLMHLTQKT